MQSCLYEGRIRHRRFSPVEHEFNYRLFMLYLDLDELPQIFDGRWLWSARGRAPARFCRADFFGDPAQALQQAVRDLVAEQLGPRPLGPIRLLAQLRYWGYSFNPIALYFCFDPAGRDLQALVVEVRNTPWGERHVYVLDPTTRDLSDKLDIHFAKQMHVSPFVPMEMTYRLRASLPDEHLGVQLDTIDSTGATVVDATLLLARHELTGARLARSLLFYPWMTGQILAAIYYQAWRLWRKGVPVQPHPATQRETFEEIQVP